MLRGIGDLGATFALPHAPRQSTFNQHSNLIPCIKFWSKTNVPDAAVHLRKFLPKPTPDNTHSAPTPESINQSINQSIKFPQGDQQLVRFVNAQCEPTHRIQRPFHYSEKTWNTTTTAVLRQSGTSTPSPLRRKKEVMLAQIQIQCHSYSNALQPWMLKMARHQSDQSINISQEDRQ